MIPSNILDVFVPTESKDLSQEPQCLGCQIMGSATCLVAGAYFVSPLPFKGDMDFKKSPVWFRKSVQLAGCCVLGLGVYRGGEGWLWNTDLKYKEGLF